MIEKLSPAAPAENPGAATAQPPAEHTRREFLAAQPTVGEGFLSFEQLLPKLPVGDRSAREWTRRGILPSIRLPGSRRVLYHWPSVERALLRLQRGGGDL
jgi:hypothetical protein